MAADAAGSAAASAGQANGEEQALLHVRKAGGETQDVTSGGEPTSSIIAIL
jgi:hypothetical protein